MDCVEAFFGLSRRLAPGGMRPNHYDHTIDEPAEQSCVSRMCGWRGIKNQIVEFGAQLGHPLAAVL